MTDQLRAQNPRFSGERRAPSADPRQRDWRGVVWKTSFAILMALAVWWLVWISLNDARATTHWSQNILVPLCIMAAAGLVALRHERHWAAPLRRLNALLPQLRAGEAPIEQLSEIGGGLSTAIPHLRDLLHDLRRQKLAVAELNEEIRQRVAVRTDALERQMASLRQQASRDGLTGLYNRRMLETLLPKLIETCRQNGLDLAVLMIDIDYFKQLNDTLGHGAGDELLRDVASIVRSSIRENDIAIRYGGDEFVILMPQVESETAQAVATRLSSLVDGLTKPLRVSKPPKLSIGIALLSEVGGTTPGELLDAADRALYDIKKSRRGDAQPPQPASAVCT